ncbi:Crp/Fnr family transcriptional regulator [Myroides injenensis]|uniref:Crp/Fnr family transcriptional regulator n=1 Tax=Myroides injenensis TaxID=1183151 RepID=UPI0002892CD0|nr:Crp/Fnr family transcriptional regulator [Myroides injenensis]
MFEILLSHIQLKVELSEIDKGLLKTFFTSKKLRKGQYLLQQGQVCRDLAFVSKGVLKSYLLDDKGTENINLLGWEGWWVSDFQSFVYQEPAIFDIEAVEPCELLLISRENYERMMDRIPLMEKYFRILFERSLATKDRSLISSNAFSAEEKYNQLLANYPAILDRIPQYLLASYVGVTPETFSRIKNKKNK